MNVPLGLDPDPPINSVSDAMAKSVSVACCATRSIQVSAWARVYGYGKASRRFMDTFRLLA